MTFQPLDHDLDDDELVELERFLVSSALVETSMDLYGVDGYFAAILIGSRTLMPSEWVAWVWDSECGERAPEFEDLRHAERILALPMRHYNSVAHALMDEGEPFVPIYPNDETDAAISWCAGYLTGLARAIAPARSAPTCSRKRSSPYGAPCVERAADLFRCAGRSADQRNENRSFGRSPAPQRRIPPRSM